MIGLQQLWYTGLVSLGIWDLLRPRIEPVFSALAGRLFTTEPPEKPLFVFLELDIFGEF